MGNSTLHGYLIEIGRVPLLTDSEELVLAHAIQEWLNYESGPEGAPKAIQRKGRRGKERMINAKLRLVASVAKKDQNRGLELTDLIQEGSLGLFQAVEKFDATRGYKFSTYAFWWIRQAISRGINQQGQTIRLPIHQQERLLKIQAIARRLRQQLRNTPSNQQIADELGVDPSEVQKLRQVEKRTSCNVFLDASTLEDGSPLLNTIAGTEEYEPAFHWHFKRRQRCPGVAASQGSSRRQPASL